MKINPSRILLWGFLCISQFPASGQFSADSAGYKMGFFDLNIGLDNRFSYLRKWDETAGFQQKISDKSDFSSFYGITGRMQTSILATAFRHRMKKLVFGDIIAGELTAGLASSSNAAIKSGFWPAYRFEFGAGFIHRINQNNDWGVNLILFKFSRDLISDYFSGSNIFIKYRYKKIWVETGIEASRGLFLNWIYVFSSQAKPWQLTFNVRYLLSNNKNIGLRIENLPNTLAGKLYTDLGYEVLWNVKVFYGIYF